MKPKDFQNNSAERIVELFNLGKNRVLLADEVGLGKTIVARSVVEKMHEQAKSNGQPFKVIYVCSNQGIIQQNAHKLGINDVVPLSESRLSMQHKTLYQYQDKDYLIPITPATSLELTNGYGNANERALIFAIIRKRLEPEEQDRLKWYLDVYCDRNGSKHTYWFEHINDIERKFSEGYLDDIQKKLDAREDFQEIVAELRSELKVDNPNRKYITQLRTLFCGLSMDMLHPNLVIMDEFQRYRDLMKGGKDTEENRLAQRLFADKATKILLVSATPYKPMVTMEEVSSTGRNEQFEDFHHLMKFLMDKNYAEFDGKWKTYCERLGALSKDTIDNLIEAKNEVEKVLQKVMVRTERYVPNLTSNKPIVVTPNAEEVNEYKLLRELLSDAAKVNGKKSPSLNIDYVKSSPFLLSFMQQYVEKSFIESAYNNKRGPKKREGMLIKKALVENRKNLNCHNAKLAVLCDMLFTSKVNAADLLWIPASMPYYKPVGVFEKYSDFSKILVFSRWGFVPRMLAIMLSYTAARKFVSNKNKSSNYNALEKYKELLLSPFSNLAKLYEKSPQCEDLKDLKTRVKDAIKNKYSSIIIGRESKVHGYRDILNLLQQMDSGSTVSGIVIDKRTMDFIVNVIIASPGVCLRRCFGKDYGDTYDECCKSRIYDFAHSFVNMLGNDESQGVIKRNAQNGRAYERVIDYCVNGNLQAVFDEYAFVMGYNSATEEKEKNDLFGKMGSAIIDRSPLEIDTDESFWTANSKKTPIQRWFACDYAKLKTDDKDAAHKINVQSAFNSPFRPFVLASTSVGQEGLDFHLYCRKIVHWNLPTNPVDLEQRSGRINRYACLAIRRNVAHLNPGELDWENAFDTVYNEWHKTPNQYNDMVPYWCLPEEVIKNKDVEKIENIFLMYPMSFDTSLYHRLVEQLSLYRLTLGQPDQEFVIKLLEKSGIANDNDKKEKLMFHLAPPRNN